MDRSGWLECFHRLFQGARTKPNANTTNQHTTTTLVPKHLAVQQGAQAPPRHTDTESRASVEMIAETGQKERLERAARFVLLFGFSLIALGCIAIAIATLWIQFFGYHGGSTGWLYVIMPVFWGSFGVLTVLVISYGIWGILMVAARSSGAQVIVVEQASDLPEDLLLRQPILSQQNQHQYSVVSL